MVENLPKIEVKDDTTSVDVEFYEQEEEEDTNLDVQNLPGDEVKDYTVFVYVEIEEEEEEEDTSLDVIEANTRFEGDVALFDTHIEKLMRVRLTKTISGIGIDRQNHQNRLPCTK